METSYSGANLVVLHAHNDRWGLGPIETINSGHNDAVVNAKKKSQFCMQKQPMKAGTHAD